MDKRYVSLFEVQDAAIKVAQQIIKDYPNKKVFYLYGVPKGGIVPAFAVANALSRSRMGLVAIVNDSLELSDIIIDELIDTGKTAGKYLAENPNKDFYVLFNKAVLKDKRWYVFPWEEDYYHRTPVNVVCRRLTAEESII